MDESGVWRLETCEKRNRVSRRPRYGPQRATSLGSDYASVLGWSTHAAHTGENGTRRWSELERGDRNKLVVGRFTRGRTGTDGWLGGRDGAPSLQVECVWPEIGRLPLSAHRAAVLVSVTLLQGGKVLLLEASELVMQIVAMDVVRIPARPAPEVGQIFR